MGYIGKGVKLLGMWLYEGRNGKKLEGALIEEKGGKSIQSERKGKYE